MIHFRYGGSTIHRTLACPGWRQESDKHPKYDSAGKAANRGSALHEVLETMMRENLPAEDFLNHYSRDYEYTITADDIECVKTAYKAADDVFTLYTCHTVYVEKLVKFNHIAGGSADALAIGDNHVVLLDYKMGSHAVSAINNRQAQFYLWCALNTPELKEELAGKQFVIAIVQPAVNPEPSIWEVPRGEFEQNCRNFEAAINLAESDRATLHPGNHCMFCPAAPWCPAKRDQLASFRQLDALHAEELYQGLQLIGEIKDQIKNIETAAEKLMLSGEVIPGYKLVEKVARRQWKCPEQETINALTSIGLQTEEAVERKLRSPAQIEKLFEKKGIDITELDDIVTKVSSGLTVVPDKDRREAVQTEIAIPANLAKLLK